MLGKINKTKVFYNVLLQYVHVCYIEHNFQTHPQVKIINTYI